MKCLASTVDILLVHPGKEIRLHPVHCESFGISQAHAHPTANRPMDELETRLARSAFGKGPAGRTPSGIV